MKIKSKFGKSFKVAAGGAVLEFDCNGECETFDAKAIEALMYHPDFQVIPEEEPVVEAEAEVVVEVPGVLAAPGAGTDSRSWFQPAPKKAEGPVELDPLGIPLDDDVAAPAAEAVPEAVEEAVPEAPEAPAAPEPAEAPKGEKKAAAKPKTTKKK